MRFSVLTAAALLVASASYAPTADACNGQKTQTAELSKADANMSFASFDVAGMSCSVSCPVTIQTALTGLDGVNEVAVDFDSKQVKVSYTASEVDEASMIAAINKLGYDAKASKMKAAKAKTDSAS